MSAASGSAGGQGPSGRLRPTARPRPADRLGATTGQSAPGSAARFVLTCDTGSARALVDAVLRERGWRSERRADGALVYERGSLRATILLGALAGAAMHLTLVVHVRSDGERCTVVLEPGRRPGRALGGVLGARRAEQVHAETAAALEAELRSRGVLRG